MRFIKYAVILIIVCMLGACQKPNPNTLVVGTITGPETELVDAAQKIAQEKYGLTIKIVQFNDYNLPNEALHDGTLDANVYQHLPYLLTASKAHHYNFEVMGKTFVYPTGVYSNRVRSLNQIQNGGLIALPNDPSNEARALLLLQQAGLITLKKAGSNDMSDILTNPKHLRFKEMDAAQLPRVLDDVDAAIINTTFAIPAGLSPSRDAIYSENKNSPYANLIVIRKNSTKKEHLALFVKALNSDEVKQRAKTLFGDAAIAAW